MTMHLAAIPSRRTFPRAGRGTSVVSETPSRTAEPAAIVGNPFAAIEAGDLLPTTLFEGLRERAFRHLVTASGARKDRNCRNPAREIIVTAPLDPKHRAGARHPLRRTGTKSLVRGHRQDQASTIGEAVKPVLGRTRAAGTDVNDIGLIALNRGAVTFDDVDGRVRREIGFGSRGEFGIIFYSGHPARRSGKMRQDGRVVAGAGSDMHDVLAVGRRRSVDV